MSTTTLERTATPSSVHLTFGRVVASEWRKLFSLRSTWWTLGTAVVLQAGMAAIVGAASRAVHSSGQGDLGIDGAQVAAAGLQFSQLAIVALAVLTITAEYSSGQIRVTLAAVPRRTPVLAAKALVLVVVVLVTAVVSSALSIGAGKLVGGDTISFTLPGAETARIIAGAPLYLVAIAVLSLGVATLMRHTAGAIAALMGFLLVIQTVFAAIPWKPLQIVSPWLPGTAGQQLLASDSSVEALRAVPDHVGAVLGPWAGYGVLVAWAVLALVAAVAVLRSRDA
ncbi:MAG: ABC transporter permease [Actinobacteria bacterium]|nr:ABC transporter permease [Actinomycetota bacterium]MCG2803491.1 ABC transporter permease [Cellulomonas sp.]